MFDRRLPFGLVIGGPAIHRQQRGDTDIGLLQSLLEGPYAFRKDARRLEPFEEIGARAEFDPVVAEFLYFGREGFEAAKTVHVGVDGDFHRS